MDSNKLVCFDSQILIWGIKKDAVADQINMIGKAENFIHALDRDKIEVVIPAIVLAEILSVEPFDKQVVYLDIIEKSFRIQNFDKQVAMECARLLNKGWDEIEKLRRETNVRKDKLKFDHAIIASALVSGATCIYSHDPHIKQFGSGVIEILEIPDIGTQNTLFPSEFEVNEDEPTGDDPF